MQTSTLVAFAENKAKLVPRPSHVLRVGLVGLLQSSLRSPTGCSHNLHGRRFRVSDLNHPEKGNCQDLAGKQLTNGSLDCSRGRARASRMHSVTFRLACSRKGIAACRRRSTPLVKESCPHAAVDGAAIILRLPHNGRVRSASREYLFRVGSLCCRGLGADQSKSK
jgi:hypothetical protein